MPGSPTAYPGTNPPTVSTTVGAGAPGVVVNAGPYGVYTIPLTVTGDNDVTSANVSAADQAEQDSIVWCTWRAIDWINGGAYTWTAQVTLANALVLTGQLSIANELLIESGAELLGALGSSWVTFGSVEAKASSVWSWDSGSNLEVKSGATWTFDAGSIFVVNTAVQSNSTVVTVAGGATYNIDVSTSDRFVMSQSLVTGAYVLSVLNSKSGSRGRIRFTAPNFTVAGFSLLFATGGFSQVRQTLLSGYTFAPSKTYYLDFECEDVSTNTFLDVFAPVQMD